MSLRRFCPFFNQVVCFLIVVLRVLCTHWVIHITFVVCVFCKYFLPVGGQSFYSLDSVFHSIEGLVLMELSLSIIYFINCVLSVVSKKASPYPRLPRSPRLSPKR